MSEAPQSLWRKSWKGPYAFLFWMLTLLVISAMFVYLVAVSGGAQLAVFSPEAMFFYTVAGTCLLYLFYRLLRWLFCRRNLRRTFFIFACFATLIALFYAEEDWRGKRAWDKFKHEWAARGEHFDFASVIPPPVPDNENFALTPIVASSYERLFTTNGQRVIPYNTNIIDRLKMEAVDDGFDIVKKPANYGSWEREKFTDLKPWQTYYRTPAQRKFSHSIATNAFPVAPRPQSPAADVLLALSKYDSDLSELRRDSQLPDSRFPLNYDDSMPMGILIPHLASLKSCALTLQLRTIAELQLNQTDNALADIKLTLRLSDALRTEPFLISHLVRITMLYTALQSIWEGLAQHKWSDQQLSELDKILAKQDFLADYKVAMRGELGLQMGTLDALRRQPEIMSRLMGVFNGLSGDSIFFRLIPSGWFYQNQLRMARFMVERYLPLADLDRRIVSPQLSKRSEAAMMPEIQKPTPYNLLERLLMPALARAVVKFAHAQTAVDLARVACELERYRIAHGEYPESLDALTPQFMGQLPHDIINGQPLHYRRTDNGRFVLYSVGWNEKDDGGVVGYKKKGGSLDLDQGDWVWAY